MDAVLWILAILGALDLAGRGTHWLSVWSPRLLTLQSKMWRALADSAAIPVIRRRAIAAGIEEVVNRAVFALQHHLPKGWIKRVRIQWVRHARAAQLREGDIIIRIKPDSNPDTNLLQSLYTYFYSALFPNRRGVLPEALVSSIALAITRASLENSHPYLLMEFDEGFVRSVGRTQSTLLENFADCVRLNDYGFLMGPFIREIDYVSMASRFTLDRDKLPEMIQEILAHMLAFQPLLRNNKPDDEWYYEGRCTSYGFLLVSKPREVRPAIKAYVKRAEDYVKRGIKRLYIIGRYEEREFVSSVIQALLTIRELKGVDFFSLFRDYRGEPSGVGALLGIDEFLARLSLTKRPLDRSLLEDGEVEQQIDEEKESGKIEEGETQLEQLAEIAEAIIVQLSDYDREWIHLSPFGERLREKVIGFTPQRYGGRNLISVLRKLDSLEFDERGLGSVYVRLRGSNGRPSARAPIKDEAAACKRIVQIIEEHAREDGWMFLGAIGQYTRHEIHPVDFGAETLRELIGRIERLEIQEWGVGHEKTYVRIRK